MPYAEVYSSDESQSPSNYELCFCKKFYKVLTLQTKSETFSFSDLKNILGFEDDQEAFEYCTAHSLSLTERGVIFNRQTKVISPDKFPANSCNRLIGKKIANIPLR
jgi:hypothetical protein